MRSHCWDVYLATGCARLGHGGPCRENQVEPHHWPIEALEPCRRQDLAVIGAQLGISRAYAACIRGASRHLARGGIGRLTILAILLAALAGIRLGEARVPGPWPADAIRADNGGWTVMGDDSFCQQELQPAARRYHFDFDDPEAFDQELSVDDPDPWTSEGPLRRRLTTASSS